MSFSSLTQKYESTIFERFLLNTIKCGPIPQHLAIIMDGNRRFAKRHLSGDLTTGYKIGCTVFANSVHMCLDLGISEMTVFMFSQENANRKCNEVESILNVVLSAFLHYETELEYVNDNGISFKGLGNWKKLSFPKLSETFARLVVKTNKNCRLKINMAINYSGRDEILTSSSIINSAIKQDTIACEDLNEQLFQLIMSVNGTTPVDILIRTSGETRLSDFLLWTTNDNTYLEFVKLTWPEFKLSNFLKAVLNFQKHLILSCYKSQPVATVCLKPYILDFVNQTAQNQWDEIFELSKL